MKAKCVKKCYFQGVIWQRGEVFEGSEIHPSVEDCFVLVDPPKVPAPAKKEEKK